MLRPGESPAGNYDGTGRQLRSGNVGAGASATHTIDVEAGAEYYIQVATGQQAVYSLTFG